VPEFGNGFGENDAFLQNPTVSGAPDPNQLVFGLMGEGLRFPDDSFDDTQFQRL